MKTTDKPKTSTNTHKFIHAYENLTASQRTKFHCFMARSLAIDFFKRPTREGARMAWDVLASLLWPDLAPYVVPALALVLAVGLYGAIGAHVQFSGELVRLLAGAGCLAGAYVGYKH